MGAKVSNPKNNLQIQEPTEDIIEYEGYEEFPIIEIAKNVVMKNDKIRPNPSLNNHSGGSSIGKYESENYINKNKDKTENNEDENAKPKEESKFKKEQTGKKEENINMDNNLNNENNNIIINNVEEMKEPEKEDEKIDKLKSNNNNINSVEINLIDKKPEETDEINGGNFINNENNEINGNINDINNDINNDNIKEDINDKLNNGISEIKEEDINNEVDEKEKLNSEENINNNYEEKKIKNEKLNDINNNIENNLNLKEKEINNNEIKQENKVVNINDDLAPKKIILPDINTIISEKVLEEGAGNELLFMSYLNKIVHISIKDRVKYSQKFCVASKDNFFIYENKENYLQVKKPLAIIPICSIKNVVMFKLSKKIQSYDHFYIEFELDENNRNNVYNKIDTFYENDLDNKTNENLNNTALVMFKTEEKNLAKEWYVLLKFLINLKLKK